MLFDPLKLQALKSQLMQTFPDESDYCKKAVNSIAAMLSTNPMSWHHFGPYWPLVQKLFAKYRPNDRRPTDWGEVPDYLDNYSAGYGDDMADAIAAIKYLNRHGDWMAQQDDPHDITLPDGSEALYAPGVGIIDAGD